MMTSQNTLHPNECKCFSWKPIFVGALVAVGLSFLLGLFNVAIGITAFTTDNAGVETLAFGGLLGIAIGIIASMFGAGWLTGYLSQRHCNKRHLGALYGFLAWIVALLITVFLASQIHAYVTLYGHIISGANGTPMTGEMHAKTIAAVTTSQAKELAISAYIIFSLFFLSAFACSLGGHCGMQHKCCE